MAEPARRHPTHSELPGLLIALKDVDVREQMAGSFRSAGYHVIVTRSAAGALDEILKRRAEVVVLGSEFDRWHAGELVPVLRKCNPDVTIILVSEEASLGLLRKLRREGIFYHALRPQSLQDCEEIRQAVECAFDNVNHRRSLRSLAGGDRSWGYRPEKRREP